MTPTRHISYIVSTLAIVASSACVDDSSAAQAGGQARTQRQRQQAARPGAQVRQPATRTSQRDTVRNPQSAISSPRDSVRFVDHPQHIQLGRTAPNPSALRLTSPFGTDPQVRMVGSQLYLSYNCIDCHGMDGSGAMGPSLADGRWRFGGTASEVFESIYQGRPDGMPAWGGRISDADIWRLVAYVRSLEVGKNVSTENFTGKAQQRMGH
jgi:mono/diheme cytochrome c family protein